MNFQDLWNGLKADAAAEWKKIEAGAVALEQEIAPVVEEELMALMGELKQYAIPKIVELATEEFAALSGLEKQSEVVTHLVQTAEGLGKDVTPLLLDAARTLAQNAWQAFTVTRPAQ